MNGRRRQLLQAIGTVLACAPLRILHAQPVTGSWSSRDNFRFIYENAQYRDEFKQFLTNVFRLFPEDELHDLIGRGVSSHTGDVDVYTNLQAELDAIKPFLGDLTYALPALAKQKDVLADQCAALIDTDDRYEGYLEIGSNGRYLDSLEERFDIVGDRIFVSERAPGHSLVDILDRGQIGLGGRYIGLDDYRTDFAAGIPRASVDLATVFIGFHHCPVPLRESFIGGLGECLRPGGRLVVRDHDVRDEKMWKLVALAHDVFNMGTLESWDYNARELRHFYPLDTLDSLLIRHGFEPDGRRLFQDGDPTSNALMSYRKR
jgi:SAM-dependent methyltransferase